MTRPYHSTLNPREGRANAAVGTGSKLVASAADLWPFREQQNDTVQLIKEGVSRL